MKKSLVLIGTFRQEHNELSILFDELKKKFNVLSPKSVDFVDLKVSFVKAGHELKDDAGVIERRVLEAIKNSDFVWLFAPNGYVGVSAAFEIGFAHSLNVPVYTDSELQDEMLQTMITKVVRSPDEL